MQLVKRFFKSLRWKRFVAKYVRYLEFWGYFNVIAVGAGVVAAWVVQVEVTAESKAGNLTAYESPLRLDADCVVLRLVARDKTDVGKGDVIAEVTTDTKLVARFRALARLQSALQVIEKAEDNADLERERAQLKTAIAARSVALRDVPAGKLLKLTSPCEGMVWLGGRKVGAFVPAGKKIIGVKNFNRLLAKLTFEKRNADLCRPGYRAVVKIQPEQGFETLVRLDTDSHPAPFYGLKQDRFSRLKGTEEIRQLLVKSMEGNGLLDSDVKSEQDFHLSLTSIGGITLLVGGKAEMGEGITGDGLRPENFRGDELAGVVTGGKHTGEYTIMGLEGELQQQVERLLKDAIEQQKITRADAEYTVKQLTRITVNFDANAQMVMGKWDRAKAPRGFGPGEIPSTTEEFRKGDGSDHVKLRKRRFIGTVELFDPPAGLKQLVRRTTLQGKVLKVKGEIVVDRTRFAMKLFRKR
jgi:hypothetical protein